MHDQVLIFNVSTVTGLLQENVYKSNPTCAQLQGTQYNLNATCQNTTDVIAIKTFVVAAKPVQQNCNASTAANQFDECCSSYDDDTDCHYKNPYTPFVNSYSYSEQCNGKSTCSIQPQFVPFHMCNSTIYPEYSANYVHVDFYCVPGLFNTFSDQKRLHFKKNFHDMTSLLICTFL